MNFKRCYLKNITWVTLFCLCSSPLLGMDSTVEDAQTVFSSSSPTITPVPEFSSLSLEQQQSPAGNPRATPQPQHRRSAGGQRKPRIFTSPGHANRGVPRGSRPHWLFEARHPFLPEDSEDAIEKQIYQFKTMGLSVPHRHVAAPPRTTGLTAEDPTDQTPASLGHTDSTHLWSVAIAFTLNPNAPSNLISPENHPIFTILHSQIAQPEGSEDEPLVKTQTPRKQIFEVFNQRLKSESTDSGDDGRLVSLSLEILRAFLHLFDDIKEQDLDIWQHTVIAAIEAADEAVWLALQEVISGNSELPKADSMRPHLSTLHSCDAAAFELFFQRLAQAS